MSETQPSGKCPITYALDVFGDRWTLILLRELLIRGRRRYSELMDLHEGIATNVLASRLSRLEAHGLLTRARDPANRSRVIYSVTDKAREALPILIELARWSVKYDPQPDPERIIAGAPPRLLERYESEREVLLDEVLQACRPQTPATR